MRALHGGHRHRRTGWRTVVSGGSVNAISGESS